MSKRKKDKNEDQFFREKSKEAESSEDSEDIKDASGAEDVTESGNTGEGPGKKSDASEKNIEEQLREANEKYIRYRAEMENYRKRMQREAGDLREYAKAATVEEFLTVYDHFQMAMSHIDQASDLDTIKQGMWMILDEFRKTFENLGVKQIDAAGETFDPNKHDAVAEEPSESVSAGKVVRQWKCGYQLGDRLLRPASVIVSRGPEKKEDKGEGAEQKPESDSESINNNENVEYGDESQQAE